ncbi:MAG: four helix bundle protein [Hyphomonadaceae bacterium]
MAIQNYRDLAVWTKAVAAAKTVYAVAEQMPKKEEYRLTAQMIRAAISVPANIAEGRTRATRKDFAHFISIARGKRKSHQLSRKSKRSDACSTLCTPS